MAHTPNGPAVFYSAAGEIYVEDGVQPEGYYDHPDLVPVEEPEADGEEKPKRGRKPKAEATAETESGE